jgi:hypothetical protein
MKVIFTCFVLCLLITGVATDVSAQQMIGVSAAYELFPLKNFRASASFPLVFAKGKTKYINSIAYQYSVYDYDDWGFVQGSADVIEQYQSVSFTEIFFAAAKYLDRPITYIPEEYRQFQGVDVETLMVNGSVDFACPVDNAGELLPYLRNGELIVLAEMGHTKDVTGKQPAAFHHLVETFYLEG